MVATYSLSVIDSQSPDRLVDAAPRPLWWDSLGERPARPPLDPGKVTGGAEHGSTGVDVAIVGAGFSGLWTAHHLLELDPSLQIVLLEKHHVGFGASGRNGGWAVGELAGSYAAYAKRSSPEAALRLEQAVMGAVDEIGRTTERLGIDCGYEKGGNIRVARTAPQRDRQRHEVAHAHAIGHDESVVRLLDADETSGIVGMSNVRGGVFLAPCAALDPARLAAGLAEHVEASGAVIHEGTTVTSIEPHRVMTDRGALTARTVVCAAEAYRRDLDGQRRDLLPVYSYMVATEPLPAELWDEIGLARRPTFDDARTMVTYGQRTADDRIAFGTTGLPYRFGSVIDRSTEFDLRTHAKVHAVLTELLPQVADAAITHRWGGVLGIPRNWVPSVHHDIDTGLATLGGYVGEGVAAAQLAGRTLAELIVGHDTERTQLPWVGATSRKWEPEPLRWLGVRGSRALLARADRREERTDRPAKLAMRLADGLRGE